MHLNYSLLTVSNCRKKLIRIIEEDMGHCQEKNFQQFPKFFVTQYHRRNSHAKYSNYNTYSESILPIFPIYLMACFFANNNITMFFYKFSSLFFKSSNSRKTLIIIICNFFCFFVATSKCILDSFSTTTKLLREFYLRSGLKFFTSLTSIPFNSIGKQCLAVSE